MNSLSMNSPILLAPNTHNHPTSRSSLQNIFSDTLLSLRISLQNEDLKVGSSLHAPILKLGLESDVFIANSLLSMYSKCDEIDDARNVFDQMPHRTIVSWTAMMSAYHRNGLVDDALSLFSRMVRHLDPNEFTLSVLLQGCAIRGDGDLVEGVHSYAIRSGLVSDGFLQNCLIDAYAKSRMVASAEKLLRRLGSGDVVSWTSVVSGCLKNGDGKRALALFCRMREDGIMPNDVAMITALNACSEIKSYRVMQWIHGLVVKGNWCMSGLVLNSLMEMYTINGYFVEALAIFCSFCFSNEGNGIGMHPSAETMANLLRGCGSRGSLKLGEAIHAHLIKHGFLPRTVAENSLINMYAEHGCVDSALLVFRTMASRDVVSWNTIMKSFVKNARPLDTLKFLSEIHREKGSVSPDFVTLLTSLEACSELARDTEGRVIHGYLTKSGLLGDIFVQNALIDTHAKSGRLDLAESTFKEMRETDVGSWNSIIAAYGVNGDAASALTVFRELDNSEARKPNAVTFTNVLSACAHAGLVEEGLRIFHSMEKDYGVIPQIPHYACVVDLLGRAGRVKEAETFIDKMMPMPMPPGSTDVWGALLSACVLVGDVAGAERAAREFASLEPSSSIWRVALSNAYAAAGEWDKAAKMRSKVRKEGGWSRVNVEGREFDFFAGDTRHPESTAIYEMIRTLKIHMRDDRVSDRILLT